jgi:hypothetical protein
MNVEVKATFLFFNIHRFTFPPSRQLLLFWTISKYLYPVAAARLPAFEHVVSAQSRSNSEVVRRISNRR